MNTEKKEVSNDTKDAFKFTQKIIDECGPRLAGDESTKKAAKMIKSELKTYCDTVDFEEFGLHPNAFLGWIRLVVTTYVISTVLIWFNLPFLASLSIGFGILTMVLEFFLYKEFIDPFWKKAKGYDVIGKIEPSGEVKQQIIVSGHHDSAYVFNFFVYQPKLYPLRLYGGLGSVFLMFVLSLIWGFIKMFSGNNPEFAIILKIGALISQLLVLQLWFFRGNSGTPGAGDNMIGVAVANQVGKKFANAKKEGKGLIHTRIIIASWDAEECGLRGSRYYAQKNKEELLSIPTFNFNIDGAYFLEDLFFLTTDVNGSVKLSETMAKECKKIAEDLGYKAGTTPIEFLLGGTDAGEFGRIGVDATNLMAMPWGNTKRPAAYHTPKDTIDAIEPEVIEASIKIVNKYILDKDKNFNK